MALLALVVMEISWLALWYRSLPIPGMDIPYWRAFWVLGTMLLLAYILAFLVSVLKWSLMVQRGLFGGLLALSLWLGLKLLLYPHASFHLSQILVTPFDDLNGIASLIPPEIVVLLVVLMVWWRGTNLAEETLEPVVVLGRFRAGVWMLLAYGLLVRKPGEMAGNAIYLFLFAGLLSLSAARISLLSRLRGGKDAPFSRQWLLSLLVSAVAVVALSALTAGLVSQQVLTRIGGTLSLLKEIISLVIVLVVIPPLVLLLEVLLNAGQWLRVDAILAGFSALAEQILQMFQQIFGPPPESTPVAIPYMKQIILGGVGALFFILVIIGWQVRFLKSRHQDMEETQPIAGNLNLLQDLRSALRHNARALAGKFSDLLGMGHVRRFWAAVRIRKIYISLLELSEKLEHPRPETATPLEFLPTLDHVLPDLGGELSLITQAYLRVRYGEIPETRQEVDAVEIAWSRVAAKGQTLLAARKSK